MVSRKISIFVSEFFNQLTTNAMKQVFKNSIFVMMAALMMTACSKQNPADEAPEDGELLVTFNIPQWEHQVVSFDDIGPSGTRGTISADGKQMTDLWILDYMDGELKRSLHQSSTDDDFAAPALSLLFGSHTLYFVTSRGTNPTLSVDDHNITWEKPSDTFYYALTLNVSRGTTSTQNVVLERAATKAKISVTDQVPANAYKLILKPSTWYYGFDYINGTAVASSNQDRSIVIPEEYKASEKRIYMDVFGLAPAEAFTSDVQIRVEEEDESVIASYTIPDVRFERNHVTHYSGELFATEANRQFTLSVGDAAWGEDITGTF